MKIEVKVPSIGESITEVTMGSWTKENGAFVEEDEIICEIESEKATVEITAESAGILKQKASEGDTLPIGAVLAEIDTDSAEKPEPAQKKAPATEQEKPAPKTVQKPEPEDKSTEEAEIDEHKITPVAANILREAGIRTEGITGSGSGGRITKADALELTRKDKEPVEEIQEEPVKAGPQAAGAKAERNVRRVRMTTLRKTISERMLAAKHGTAMLTTINEVDLSEVKKIRAEYKETFKEKFDVGLGFMSFFTRAVCVALQEMPVINAMIDADEIVYHDFCDISIAVSTDKGLVVPVIRNAEKITLAEIEKEIETLATKARNNKLTIEEMTGGTFSITNGGVFGSLISTPIINAPQSAILGMHTIQDRPVVRNGEIVIRPMMYISLSYDHRIIDGKDSVTFVVRLKELLENPIRLLLGV